MTIIWKFCLKQITHKKWKKLGKYAKENWEVISYNVEKYVTGKECVKTQYTLRFLMNGIKCLLITHKEVCKLSPFCKGGCDYEKVQKQCCKQSQFSLYFWYIKN